MTDKRKADPRGAFSRWMMHRMNARTTNRIRHTGGSHLGSDLLILHTVGRRSAQPRQSPVAWFGDGNGAWLIIGSGAFGFDQPGHPDWYRNLMAHPDRASVELHGGDVVPVTPQLLEGSDRAAAWQQINAARPRYGKYQRKSEREYPIVRLAAR